MIKTLRTILQNLVIVVGERILIPSKKLNLYNPRLKCETTDYFFSHEPYINRKPPTSTSHTSITHT